jgi:hypothetical protein
MDNIILEKVKAKTVIIFKMIVLTSVQVVLAIYLFKFVASYRENYSMADGLLSNLPAIVIGNIYLIPLILMLIGLYHLSVAWGNTQISQDK